MFKLKPASIVVDVGSWTSFIGDFRMNTGPSIGDTLKSIRDLTTKMRHVAILT